MKHPINFAVEKYWQLLFKHLRIDEHKLLQKANIPYNIFSREKPTLSAEEYFSLWNAMEECCNLPAMPIIISDTGDLGSLHPIFIAAQSCANFNHAIARICEYKKLVGPLKIEVMQTETTTNVTFDCLYTEEKLPATMAAAETVFLTRLLRNCTLERIVPEAVILPEKLLDIGEYIQFFGVTPKVSNKAELIISQKDATRPFLSENPSLQHILEPELRRQLNAMSNNQSFTDTVRRVIYEQLPSGNSAIEDIARTLHISKRTLQRHLSKENTTFQEELNSTREELARHYLTNSDLSGAQISFLLGFSDPNSFIRAFRNWTGSTPKQLRNSYAV